MGRATILAMGVMAAMLASGPAEGARRRIVRCCVTVPADGTHVERPYCFNLRVRSVRLGRRICRALDGEVPRPVVR
jgi:hypothetical protein